MLERGVIVAADFRIDGILGDGGMGVVYEATQLSLERTVALKLVATSYSRDIGFRERFRREGRIQATLEHPHVIDVYAAGESEYGLYLAMRLVRGPSLAQLIGKPELTVERTVKLLTQIASALDAAHEVGLIHRDMKPHNILIDQRREHSYLADFGVTKARGTAGLTQVGQLVGTLAYMAPEQFRGHEATERSDIYSFGAVLYESLVGTVPFAMPTEASIINAHLSEPVPTVTARRPDLPSAVDGVIARAMAKEPEERYPTASELMEELERALAAKAPAPATRIAEIPRESPAVSGATRIAPAEETQPKAPATEVARPAAEPVPEVPEEAAAATVASASPVPDTDVKAPAATTASVPVGPEADATILSPANAVPGTVAAPTPEPVQTEAPVRDVPPMVQRQAPATPAATEARPQAAAAPPAAAERRRPRAATSRRVLVLGALAVAGLAAVGFFAGSGSAPDRQRTVVDRVQRQVESGPLAVSVPASWRKQASAPSIPGLELDGALALAASADGSSGGFVADTARRAWPSFLPAAFRKAIGSAAVRRRQIVRLGGLSAFRYANLRPKGFDGSVTVYAVPQARTEAILACYGTGGAPPESCDEVAASLRLDSGKDYPLAPSSGYAAAVRSAMNKLDAARSRELRALSKASTQKQQAAAAKRVATAYGTLVKRLKKAKATAYVKPAHTTIVSAAQAVQRAYVTLGNAAAGGSRGRYDAARKLVRTRETRLRQAVDRLGDLGFKV